MNYKTLHVGYVGKQREYLQGIDELPSLFLTALNLECEDATATVREVLLIELVVRMTLESWVINLAYLWMLSEEIYHFQSILCVTLYAKAKSLYALQENECVERRDSCTCVAKNDGTDTCNVCSSTYSISEYYAMI